MFNYIEKRFNLIKKTFEKKNLSTFLIEKAFEIAKNLHSTQVRKDGTPYLSHPVEVALILSELDFDEDVISAALLHDVVEDCGYTLTEIQENFNNNVSELVDCVSSIDNAKYVLDKENLYEDENFFKLSVEDQTFKKLIKIGKNNPSGFCIKFADRLHNLRTIECFSYNKQLEKVRETPFQHMISADERGDNLIGSIACKGEVEGKIILLCDDVKTTGSTLNECVKVLKEKGAEDVYCICYATSEYRQDIF